MSRRLSSRLRDRSTILRASVSATCEHLESRQLLSAVGTNPGGAPNGPYNLTLTAPQPTAVTLSFVDNADSETGFVVERSSNLTTVFSFVPVATLPPSPGRGQVITYTDLSFLAPNTLFEYRVRAVNGTYDSSFAGPQAITTPGTGGGGSSASNPGGPPNGPYHIGVSSNGGIPQVSFVDNATNETNFFVERATAATGPWTTAAVVVPSPGSGLTVTVPDATAAPGTTYFYRAYAVNGPYQSSIAGPVAFTTATSSTTFTGVPNGPYNLTANATSSTSAQLQFTNNANNESRFVIERSTDAGFANSTLTNMPQVATVGQRVTYTDTSLTAGATYFYRVYAANEVPHISGPSGTALVVTPAAAAQAAYGLDGTFGINGIAGAATTNTSIANVGFGVQPDGAVIVGADNSGSFALNRYTDAGIRDFTFGGSGVASTVLANAFFTRNFVLQPDGKIVVAGYSDHSDSLVLVERLTAAGMPDPTFGVNGVVNLPALNLFSNVSVAIAPDGKVVIGAVARGAFDLPANMVVERLGTTGIPDPTFGTDGVASAPAPYVNFAGTGTSLLPSLNDLVVGPAGQVVVVGEMGQGNTRPVLRAFDANGAPLTGVFPDALPSATTETVRAAAFQTDGGIIITGTANNGDGYVARYNVAGALDSTFGVGGVVDATVDPSLYLTVPDDLRLQPDGKILVAGFGRKTVATQPVPLLPKTAASNFYLARLNTNGAFDTTFSPTGVIQTAVGGGGIDAIAIAANGGIVAVGDGGSLLARYIPGGTGGSLGGVPNGPFNLLAASYAPGSVALQFFDNSTNETAFQIDRASFSGNHRGDFSPLATLAAQPGTGPVSFTDTTAAPGAMYQYRLRAVDGSVYASDYVVASAVTLTGNVLANGAAHLDHSFGDSGAVVDASAPGAVHVAVQRSGKLIVESVVAGFVILSRYNANGSPDPSFGASGVLNTLFQGGNLPSLAIQSDGKILIAGGGFGSNDFQAGSQTSGPSSAVAERFTADGVLDASFGTNGEYRIGYLPGLEFGGVTTLAVAADDRIALIGTHSRDLSIPPAPSVVTVLSPDGKQEVNYTSSGPPVFVNVNQLAAAFGPGDSLTVIGDTGGGFLGTRYEPTGSSAPSGVITLPAGAAASGGLAVAVQGDGKPVVVGTADASALIARFNNDLTLDPSFALGGQAQTVSPPVSHNLAASYDATLILPDGSILAAGQYRKDSAANGDLLLSKFTSNGQLDRAFASEGSIAIDIGSNDDNITSLVRAPDGTVVGAGVAFGHLVLIKYALA